MSADDVLSVLLPFLILFTGIMLLAAGPSFAPEGGLDRFVRLPYTQPAHVLTVRSPR